MTTAITATTAGSSSTEDLNFAADSDASGAGAIVVSTNGVERMRVLNGGNVGIGTSVPKSALDVMGGMSLGAYGGVNAAPTNGLIVSGNVGIGTTAPAEPLHVRGGGGAPATSGTAQTGALRLQNTTTSNVLDFGMYTASPFGAWLQNTNYTNLATNYPLILQPNGGNVGIGTTAPGAALDIQGATQPQVVVGSTGVAAGMMVFRRYSDGSPQGVIGYASGTESSNFSIHGDGGGGFITLYTAGSERVRVTNVGNVGIGTTSPSYTLHVNGSVAGVGSYNALSDIRYKKDIKDLAGSLVKVLAMRGVSYKWIDEDKYGSDTQFGVIAQEIERIVPEVVTTGADGVKRVKYDDLIPLIIEAMKAAQHQKDAEITALKADAAQLRAEKDAEIAQLKAALCSKFPELPFCPH
jgi:hypothetical protein